MLWASHNEIMATDAQGRQLSEDGNYYWDGSDWQLVDDWSAGSASSYSSDPLDGGLLPGGTAPERGQCDTDGCPTCASELSMSSDLTTGRLARLAPTRLIPWTAACSPGEQHRSGASATPMAAPHARVSCPCRQI